MTLNLQDKRSIDLTASRAGDDLQLFYDETSMLDYDHDIFHDLRTLGEASLTIASFVEDQITYEVHAWEVSSSEGSNGELLSPPWSRSTAFVTSGPRNEMDAVVLLIAAPAGVVPEPTSADGPPPPGTSKTVLTVKVRKQGSMPGR